MIPSDFAILGDVEIVLQYVAPQSHERQAHLEIEVPCLVVKNGKYLTASPAASSVFLKQLAGDLWHRGRLEGFAGLFLSPSWGLR